MRIACTAALYIFIALVLPALVLAKPMPSGSFSTSKTSRLEKPCRGGLVRFRVFWARRK